jgi:lysyl oxidase-like protein 2/3/4
MTSFARAILSDYRGHLLFNTEVEKVVQRGKSVLLSAKNGLQIQARYLISTIPL